MTTTLLPSATDEPEFVAELRRLKAWSGHSFRELERRASAAGDVLPHSTVATMLAKSRLPRAELVAAFVKACGLEENDVAQWVAARAAIAGEASVPRRRVASRWRLVIAGAALAVAFVGGAVAATVLGNDVIAVHEVEIDAP
jgi:hypothetical protein